MDHTLIERDQMGNKIHTVIFDLDGTLSDSAVLTVAAFKKIAPAYDLPIPSLDAIRKATGNPNPEFYYILYPDFPRDKVYEMGQQVEETEQGMLPSVRNELLFKDCLELLRALKRSNIRLYIASTGDTVHVMSILKETGIIDFFDIISCHRPDKIEMLRELTDDKSKNGYIMVGDMKKDYEGARANNILSVGACYGYCKRDLTDFDLYIDSPLELLQILNIQEDL
jgi:phosphoglycolate phosphatase